MGSKAKRTAIFVSVTNHGKAREGVLPNPAVDILGAKFGRWTVLERGPNIGRSSGWICDCDCGTRQLVRGCNLTAGITKSCGCYQREAQSKRARRHGECNSSLYHRWNGMKMRCTPGGVAAARYYDRGIRVCEEWQKYENFRDWALANGYKDATDWHLDRIDPKGNYEPSNCRFVSRYENCSRATGKFYNVFGEELTLSAAVRRYGIDYGTVRGRLKAGWSIERALTTRPQGRFTGFAPATRVRF